MNEIAVLRLEDAMGVMSRLTAALPNEEQRHQFLESMRVLLKSESFDLVGVNAYTVTPGACHLMVHVDPADWELAKLCRARCVTLVKSGDAGHGVSFAIGSIHHNLPYAGAYADMPTT